MHRIPKHLNLWLNKSLLNFSGTDHKLHRQKTHNSTIYRCCLTEPELDALHVLYFKQELFKNFKREIFAQSQQDRLRLIEAFLTPLLLLETMIQIERVPLLEVTVCVNADLQRFGRRKL